jgi:peptide/nickel transport system substrate-binding protein
MSAQQQPIPSAGPYYVASSSREELILARNPNYGGRRPRLPARIVYSFGVGLPSAVKEVATGRSDYLDARSFSADAPALLQMLERRYGPDSAAARSGHQQYFVNPWLSLDYLVFNTARPLFATARVRRAVNYAIDRRALVQHHALLDVGRATDHYLLPGIPGARPVNVYPLGAPNLAQARRLAAGAHPRGTLLVPAGDPQASDDAAIVKADLAEIGISIEITPLSGAHLYTSLKTPGYPWDIAWTNWGADFADPFTMINELYDPANNAAADYGHFNDPALTGRMRQAATLSGDRRLQAYARLDEDLTRDDPPSAPWGIETLSDFFSGRAGCQVYQPIYGIDLASLCLRH